MMIVYADVNSCLNMSLLNCEICECSLVWASVCFVPGESRESSGYQHSQWQRTDLRPKHWTHRLSCRVKPRLLWLTCPPQTWRWKVKAEPCCDCPQHEPDCLCFRCVIVLFHPKKNKQTHIINASRWTYLSAPPSPAQSACDEWLRFTFLLQCFSFVQN